MKKSVFKLIYTIILLFPIIAYAYGIDNYYVNATLEDDGDLRVQEYFNMNGEFNGMERIILYANDNAYTFNPDLESYGGSKLNNGTGLKINEIRAVDINDNFNFKKINGKLFKRRAEADAGDYGIYTMTSQSSGYAVKIFLPSKKN